MALLGLNGAGKTTLLSLVTRLFAHPPRLDRVQGHRVDREPGEALRRLGVVFQARTLDLDLSVTDNLLFHAALHGIAGRDARARATEALAEVGTLGPGAGGGPASVRRARCAAWRSRGAAPPASPAGVGRTDGRARRRRAGGDRQRTCAAGSERGVAVLWATHLLDEVEPSDRVAVLHRGRMLAKGKYRT